MKLNIISFVLCCCAVSICHAQTNPVPAEEDPGIVGDGIEVRFFSWALGQRMSPGGAIMDEDEAQLRMLTGGELKLLQLPNGRISEPLRHDGSAELVLYPSWVSNMEMAEQAAPLISLKLPARTESMLLVLVPTSYQKSSFTYKAIDTSSWRIPAATALFENLGSAPLAAKFNQVTARIPPNGSHLLELRELDDKFLTLQLAAEGQDGWVKVIESKRRMNPSLRYLVILHPNANSTTYGMLPMVLQN